MIASASYSNEKDRAKTPYQIRGASRLKKSGLSDRNYGSGVVAGVRNVEDYPTGLVFTPTKNYSGVRAGN